MIFSRERQGSQAQAVQEFLLAGACGSRPRVGRRNRQQLELMFRAFCVLVRRRLARAHGSEAISGYVHAAFWRLGVQISRSARGRAIELVRLGLGREDHPRRIRRPDPRLLQYLLLDLAAELRLIEADVDHLMETALAHAARFAPDDPAFARQAPSPGNQPRSVVGRSLSAIGRYDFDELAQLPEDPSDRCVREVCRLAFSYAVYDRFGGSPDSFQIGQLARNVAKLARKPAITAELAEEVIRAELKDSATRSDVDDDVRLEATILVFARIVEDLGMYESELNALIRKAERAAEEQGIGLTLIS